MDLRRRHDRSPSKDRIDPSPLLGAYNSNHNNTAANRLGDVTRQMKMVATAFVILALVRIGLTLSNSQQFQRQQQQHPPPLVCSHQILNPPALSMDAAERLGNIRKASGIVPPDGSLDAMTALWHNGGVTCFDIDVIVLKDGTLLASHPRRLTAALESTSARDASKEFVLEDRTLESIHNLFGGHTTTTKGTSSFPFPVFDTQVLPHFAKLKGSLPGTFSAALVDAVPAWDLKGPLLNIDLKQGPYLTKDVVLGLAREISKLQLEDSVAVCVTAPEESPDASQVDLLTILHQYNLQEATDAGAAAKPSPRIPLGLVLRDLVPADANVDTIRELVQTKYPESIRALVPSFKFSAAWYAMIRDPSAQSAKPSSNNNNNKHQQQYTNELWKLPMTVWTIDSKEDYRFVASLQKFVDVDRNGNQERIPVPMVSAVVANKPMELSRDWPTLLEFE